MGRRLLNMWFGVVSLFPEMFSAVTESGVTRRACEKGLISVTCFNPRDYAYDKYKTVDDKPYGGGPGMLMKVQPLRDAINAARAKAPAGTKVVCMSPLRAVGRGITRHVCHRCSFADGAGSSR